MIYSGKRISLSVEQIRDQSGRERTHESVLFGEGVAIVPLVESRILLVRQFRPSIGQSILEIPAGKVEHGEDIQLAAARELEEETGLSGGTLTFLSSIWTTPGFCDERIHLYLSEGGVLKKSHPDDGEEIEEILFLTVGEVWNRIRTGSLNDAKSVAGFLLYYQTISREP
ncbi:MAG: NUDIX hydrolase [Leptospirales bacterium]